MRNDHKTCKMPAVAPRQESAQRSAYLIVVGGPASPGSIFRIEGDMTVGRALDAELVLEDEDVSRHHAKVVRHADGQVELTDLGSTNGTFRNGQRVDRCVLTDGDRIQLGLSTILKFSQQAAQEEAWQLNLYDLATRDGLTRVYNRRFFDDAIRKEWAYAERHRTPLSVLMMDVDHFKRVNDGHGHAAGDHVLQTLAGSILKSIRQEDVFARYGGEEFVLALRAIPAEQGWACAERVRRLVERTAFAFEGTAIPVTISIGTATYVQGNFPDPTALVQAADQQLYQAKQHGRNRVEPALFR